MKMNQCHVRITDDVLVYRTEHTHVAYYRIQCMLKQILDYLYLPRSRNGRISEKRRDSSLLTRDFKEMDSEEGRTCEYQLKLTTNADLVEDEWWVFIDLRPAITW